MSAAAPPPADWLLLRGLLREAGHWGDFLDDFRAGLGLAPGVRAAAGQVRALDLPGCGALHAQPAPGRVGELVAFARGALPLRPRARRWLLGLSLGGMVVSHWLRRHPVEVAGAVVISSSAGDLSLPWARMRPAGAYRLVRAALARTLEERERQVFQATSTRKVADAETVARWVALAQQQPVTRGNAARLLLAGQRFRLGKPAAPAVGARAVPVLVLAGAGDRLVHPDCSRALARALGAELQIHPSAGHDLPLDDPRWVIEAIAGWRRRLAQPEEETSETS